MSDRLTVKQVSDIMNVSQQYIRIGLQTNRLPFGTAVKLSSKWTYHISPNLFKEYMKKSTT